MIRVKPGVAFTILRSEMYGLWSAFELLFAQAGLPMRITCGTDGHTAPDPHPVGCAYDLDTHNVPGQARELTSEEKHHLVDRLREVAGDRYYIFLENEGQEGEHIHWQIRKDLWPQIAKGEA